MEKEKFYSPHEVAKMYNVKEETVRKWLYRGNIRGIKMGRLWRIPESALREFIEGGGEKGENKAEG
ncbi:helix-turn-helix domain-containing protein [Neomoorella thermoacetica]|uniref:helix-turn-helix domain-containing protein n=1 Tax=Neomoorella thermoacetica TaxID=1525 RepID=UPI0030CED12B